MLFLLTILVVAAAIVSIAVLLKVQKNRQSLSTNNQTELEPPKFRSLFEPDEAEIRALERKKKVYLEKQKRKKQVRDLMIKEEQSRDFVAVWENLPNRRNTVELLHLASQSQDEETYFWAAALVLEFWRKGKIVGLSANNLADILESHFWLLPSEQRTSGVRFWLNQEIADLRRKFS